MDSKEQFIAVCRSRLGTLMQERLELDRQTAESANQIRAIRILLGDNDFHGKGNAPLGNQSGPGLADSIRSVLKAENGIAVSPKYVAHRLLKHGFRWDQDRRKFDLRVSAEINRLSKKKDGQVEKAKKGHYRWRKENIETEQQPL